MNKLIFLGTGAAASLVRQMTSLCFVVGKKAFLIDCGDGTGTVRQLVRAGVPLSAVNDILITHKHRDHIMGVPSFLFHNIVIGKSKSFRIYGPKQALDILEYMLFATHTYDDERRKQVIFEPLWSHQFVPVLAKPKTSVTGILLTKQDPKIDCMAYVVQLGKSKIAFTGDIQPDSSFDLRIRGIDMLVHECFATSENEKIAHANRHSTAKDAGICAQKSGAKKLILTHIPPKTVIGSEQTLINEARQYFTGDIIVAQDLLEVAV